MAAEVTTHIIDKANLAFSFGAPQFPKMRLLSLMILCAAVEVEAFFAPSPLRAPCTFCNAAKGFGNTGEMQYKQAREKKIKSETPVPVAAPNPEETAPTMNAGQRALEKIRRERAEQKNAELQRARELLQQDIQAQQTEAAIPEKVAQRMGQRMIPFVGIPLFLSMGVFVGFWYMATYRDMSFEPSLVAASTILILVLGLLVSIHHDGDNSYRLSVDYTHQSVRSVPISERVLHIRSCRRVGIRIVREVF